MKTTLLIAAALFVCLSAGAQTNSYTVTPIVNNTQDPYLINPWGLSRPVKSTLGENEWWASDNGTGYTTLYYADRNGSNSLAPLVISIPTALGAGVGSPTGTVYNGNTGPGPGKNNFAFATLDGTISNWNAGQLPAVKGTGCYECHVTSATVVVNRGRAGASYTGLTIANAAGTNAPTFYAANNNAGVETYDAATFKHVVFTGKFTDPQIPTSYKPYGIQTIGNNVWVTFFNGSAGGFVDAFDVSGKLKKRLAQGSFSEPWGVAQAPANFGSLSNAILVGNVTSGWIAAFDSTTGAFKDYLRDSGGNIITLPGLWGISFGNGNHESGPTNTLYYAAGGVDEKTGVFGAITANQ
ncbi:MAG: TIGR03118 family protein [Acidobacteriales bacterium]|nr:TIGR03118 family protein [Terriglobales bacterium]